MAMSDGELTAGLPAAAAGRVLLRQQLQQILCYQTDLRLSADPVAVHETRKAIRRTFTAFRMFEPYFAPGVLRAYRRRLRRMMRRLGASRDLAVLRQHLAEYNAQQKVPLTGLARYWEQQQALVDEGLRIYFGKPKRRDFLDRYEVFCCTPGVGVARDSMGLVSLIDYVAPGLIYDRLAAVRTTGRHLAQLDAAQLHQLRIQFKELRYALDFLTPILGPEAVLLDGSLNQVQDHLGALNDARVALQRLDEVPGLKDDVRLYRTAQEALLAQLQQDFGATWASIDNPAWRQDLAQSIAVL